MARQLIIIQLFKKFLTVVEIRCCHGNIRTEEVVSLTSIGIERVKVDYSFLA
jgi:hypothetical protein